MDDLAQPDQPAGAAVDLSVLLSLTSRLGDRGPAMLHRLLDTWEGEVAKRLQEIREAVEAADAAAVARAAHSLRGGSASIGAQGLSAACEQVEVPIRDGRPVDLARAQAQIAAAVEQARAGFAQLRVGSGG